MKSDVAFFIIPIILWIWLDSPTIIDGARILGIFPIPGKSHLLYHEAMMRSLYNAGHEITFISPFLNDKSLKNYSVVNIRQNVRIHIGILPISFYQDMSLYEKNSKSADVEARMCKNVLDSPDIQNLMKCNEKHYDVMFTEIKYMFPCYLPLAEKLNIPVIGTEPMRSWILGDEAIGNPRNPAATPFEFSTFSDKMTFLERLQNLWMNLYNNYIYNFHILKKLKEIYNQYYTPDLLNKKQISIVFTNNHLGFLTRPTEPRIIDVGGIHIKPAKSLPKNYQKFIDKAEHGVILFSLGSVAQSSSLNPDLIIAFRDAFAEIPQRVIWKFEEPLVNVSGNIMLQQWIPQRDILAHKNVKAFMSHCGMSGTYEGLIEAVPMIFIPLFLDQMSNAALLEKLGVGLTLDVRTVTKEKVLVALNTIVNDTRYRDTMKQVSERFNDRPMSPQESVVYWTEYVIRHNGAPHMRPFESETPFYQYFLLDIIAAIIITAASTYYVVAKVTKQIYHLILETA